MEGIINCFIKLDVNQSNADAVAMVPVSGCGCHGSCHHALVRVKNQRHVIICCGLIRAY